ncbi:MAG: galactokinase family protein [Anaerolineaceae bacterium]
MILDDVQREFLALYGRQCAATVRAPGRVNLIGEHTDYSDLPVLPMAIEQGLMIAASAREDSVVNVASSQFELAAELHRGQRDEELVAPWHRYLAGALAQLVDLAPGRGADVFVAGNLPSTGGLSSSSALTVGVLAALAEVWGVRLAPDELVSRAIVAERHVGVESGGMDQAVIVFAEAGNALRIDFKPPGRRFVAIPDGLAFVVASSGEEAPKGGGVRDQYNERVVGARIAAAMIADEVGVDLDFPPTLGQISDVDVVDILVDGLPERVTPQEVAHGAQVEVARLVQLTSSTFDHMAKVPVKRIARHVLAEAERVGLAEAALQTGDLKRFGVLLNESHNSLREDFRCSTAALDRLCAAMRKAGAFGARLTGAGFGGFALAACAPMDVDAVVAGAIAAAGGPAFEVRASDGLRVL